ncbi:hypothetical protein ACOMHN_009781 [Nucella lapillus]
MRTSDTITFRCPKNACDIASYRPAEGPLKLNNANGATRAVQPPLSTDQAASRAGVKTTTTAVVPDSESFCSLSSIADLKSVILELCDRVYALEKTVREQKTVQICSTKESVSMATRGTQTDGATAGPTYAEVAASPSSAPAKSSPQRQPTPRNREAKTSNRLTAGWGKSGMGALRHCLVTKQRRMTSKLKFLMQLIPKQMRKRMKIYRMCSFSTIQY